MRAVADVEPVAPDRHVGRLDDLFDLFLQTIVHEIGPGVGLRQFQRALLGADYRPVDAKMRALRKIKTQLNKLARACENRETTAACPILEALR